MARRRYTSTDISIDKKVNKLAAQYGDFAALLYSWMIPHVEDNCELAGDPEELMGIVCPLRRDKTEEDIQQAINGMAELKLITVFVREGKTILLFPPKSFYKFQTYISKENRDYSAANQRGTPENAEKRRKVSDESLERSNDKALNGIDAEKRRETPRNAVSLPPPPSLSPSPLKDEEEERARDGEIFKFFNENIGLITPFQAETISKHLDEGMEPGMILDVLTDSLGKTEKWSWINKVLANSSETKTKTLLQFREKKRLLAEARKKPPNRPPGIPQKGNFEQRKYTDEDFESLYKDV